jgi:hypothetical protein
VAVPRDLNEPHPVERPGLLMGKGSVLGGIFNVSNVLPQSLPAGGQGHREKEERTEKARQLFYGERRFRRCAQMYADMKNGYAFL